MKAKELLPYKGKNVGIKLIDLDEDYVNDGWTKVIKLEHGGQTYSPSTKDEYLAAWEKEVIYLNVSSRNGPLCCNYETFSVNKLSTSYPSEYVIELYVSNHTAADIAAQEKQKQINDAVANLELLAGKKVILE